MNNLVTDTESAPGSSTITGDCFLSPSIPESLFHWLRVAKGPGIEVGMWNMVLVMRQDKGVARTLPQLVPPFEQSRWGGKTHFGRTEKRVNW